MPLQCGLVGLPNVGKSMLFNTITGGDAVTVNRLFCTVGKNIGVAKVPDSRLDELSRRVKPKRTIPATVEFVDVAGLVKGSSHGEGVGNQFLSHVRDMDLLLEVVRCFEDPEVMHVDGSVDPVRDVEVLGLELVFKDLETVEKRLEKDEKVARSGSKEAKVSLETCLLLKEKLEEGVPARDVELDEKGQEVLRTLHLLSAKPKYYCANVDEGSLLEGNQHSRALEELAASEGIPVLRVAAKMEEEIAQLEPEEQLEYLAEFGLEEPGLNRVIRTTYDLLGLQTFLTEGPKEVRAWTIRKGTKAPQAAGVIHSDFEKGFIRVEVMSFEEWDRSGTWNAAKEAGLMRVEGKAYEMRDGDLCHFLVSS